MRTLAIGDIHGGYKALLQVLERAEVTSEDRLIFMGDLVDGWSESFEVIDHLIELNKHQSCLFIKGNHDLYCEYWLTTGQKNPEWDKHGGKETQEGYANRSNADIKRHIEFYQNMTYYHIDDKNRLFIHAGFTSMHGPQSEHYESNYIWDRTLLETAVGLDPTIDINSVRYPNRLKHFKEIYIGHTPTQHYGQETPIHVANLWNVDTGAAFKGTLTALDIDTKTYWQSAPVYSLYPNELGRNKS
ncbi:MAG: metallophosphoesterase family protein [Saprospiraceae bacterium]|nr:metallophosphoesterase family protein [Saprospiraceae bacterium]